MADKSMPEGLRPTMALLCEASMKYNHAVLEHLSATKGLLMDGKITHEDALASMSIIETMIAQGQKATFDVIEALFKEQDDGRE